MTKVRFEAFLWGAGTALGELPPYFMARASRLSADKCEVKNICELRNLQKRKENGEKLNLFDSGKLAMEKFVEKVGFLGILICASVIIMVYNKQYIFLIYFCFRFRIPSLILLELHVDTF